MAKGNFIALQPSKPVEYKIGDLYGNLIDNMIKRGDAEKAAALKQAQMQGKSLDDILKEQKVDYIQTVAPLQDGYNARVRSAIESINSARMQAQNLSIPLEQRQAAAQRATNLTSGVKQLGTFLGTEEFRTQYAQTMQDIQDNNVFQGDPRAAIFKSIAAGTFDLGEDQAGNITVTYAGNTDDKPDAPATTLRLSELTHLLTTPMEKNLLDGKDGFIDTLATEARNIMTSQSINKDGNRTNASEKFDRERGATFLKSLIGYNPEKSIDEEFDVNAIPRTIAQFYRVNAKKDIASAEDMKEAFEMALNTMQSATKESTKVDTKYTAAQLAKQQQDLEKGRLDIIAKKQDIANGGRKAKSGESETSVLGEGTLSASPIVLNTRGTKGGTNHYQTMGVNYFVAGNTNDGKNSRVGVTAYWNPNGGSNGKGAVNFAVNMPSADGKEVVGEKADLTRVAQILTSNKVKDVGGVVNRMVAEASQLRGTVSQNKSIGKNIKNYKVNFSTEKNSENSNQDILKRLSE